MWFMDVASMGGFTAAGTAAVMQERLYQMTPEDRPPWMEGLAPDKVNNILTRVIMQAVEASHVVQAYMDEEREKGRDFDEIYAEIKPYIDHVSKPIIPQEVTAWGDNLDVEEGPDDDPHFGVGMGGPSPPRPSSSAEPTRGPAAYFQSAGGARPEYEEYLQMREQQAPKAKDYAPHRRLMQWPDDESFRSLGASSRTNLRQAAAEEETRPAEESDEVETQDIDVPLMLVGSCNGWSLSKARRSHTFLPVDGHSTFREYKLRVNVPEGGLTFQITSTNEQRDFWIFPNSRIRTLKMDRMHHVEVGLKKGLDAEGKARGREFKIRDSAPPVVTVRVAISVDRGVRVWFTDDADDDPIPQLTME